MCNLLDEISYHVHIQSNFMDSVPINSRDNTNSKTNNVLYDLQFIETNNEHYLVVSGDVGIVMYKWSQFEEAISAAIDGNELSIPKPKKVKCQDPVLSTSSNITPITTFKPHTSTTFGSCVEINSISYDKSNGILYGAAGDVFGCYQYDIATEKLLGTFGASGGRGSVGHTDYLHVVKTIPESDGMGSRYVMTGGEDGNLGFWDGKERKLIEMMNIQSTMNKNKHLVTSDTTTSSNRGFSSSTNWNNNASNSNNIWVSSVATNGNWLAVCGGSENNSGRSGPNSSGFMTLWHLPTRTFTSGRVTRESINTVVHNNSLDSFVTGGNEGRVSFWESTSAERSSRSWCTPPATYSLSVDPDSNSMVVGGTGGILDCFVDRVKTSQLCI